MLNCKNNLLSPSSKKTLEATEAMPNKKLFACIARSLITWLHLLNTSTDTLQQRAITRRPLESAVMEAAGDKLFLCSLAL